MMMTNFLQNKSIMRLLISSLLIIFTVTLATAQKEPRFGIFGSMGVTQPFSDFDYVGEGHPNFKATSIEFSPNEMLGITLFHKKDWFSRYFYARYLHSLGAKGEDSEGTGSRRATGAIDAGLGIQIGKTIWQPAKRWKADAFGGLYFENVVERSIHPARGGVVTRIGEDIKYGWLPCVQLGGQVSYQLKHIRFVAMLFGNVGTRYIEQFNYRADIDGESYFASIRSKRDVLVLNIGCELLLGDKNKKEPIVP
jgi:hypothetical protein